MTKTDEKDSERPWLSRFGLWISAVFGRDLFMLRNIDQAVGGSKNNKCGILNQLFLLVLAGKTRKDNLRCFPQAVRYETLPRIVRNGSRTLLLHP